MATYDRSGAGRADAPARSTGGGRPDARRRAGRPARTGVLVAAAAVGVLSLSACTTGQTSGGAAGAATRPGATSTSTSVAAPATGSSSTSTVAAPVTLTAAPASGRHVNPLSPVTVTAAGGRLTAVRMVNDSGRRVTGAFSADHTSWHTTEVLGYGRRYTIAATGTDATGEQASQLRRSFTTLTPSNQTLPYFQTLYGSPMQDGATYGIGMIPVVRFDEPIPDRAAAEKQLVVTTTPHVDGSWTWVDNETLHWRPRHFYAPGTTVTIAAKVYGHDLGDGLYGQSDESTSFRIGASHISIADDRTHEVKVFFNGKLARTMPTSMGEHSGETVNGQYISFWTMRGTYTVIGHEQPAHMCSASYGLPPNAPGGYPCEDIPWSTKISTDGVYLHELDSTISAQGHYDTSHGCLNLNRSNASWYFDHSLVGDVVQVVHMPGAPKITLAQGGDWSVPWRTWIANSALS